jgi:hypothetical protein
MAWPYGKNFCQYYSGLYFCKEGFFESFYPCDAPIDTFHMQGREMRLLGHWFVGSFACREMGMLGHTLAGPLACMVIRL